MKMGKKVTFTGCSEEQRKWGSYTGDISKLKVGNKYKVKDVEIHTWHTKVFLEGIEGSFNSVCFE